MFALLMGTLMACHTVEKIEGTAASSADPCSGPILVPQVGLSDDDREAADADQLTFTSTPGMPEEGRRTDSDAVYPSNAIPASARAATRPSSTRSRRCPSS